MVSQIFPTAPRHEVETRVSTAIKTSKYTGIPRFDPLGIQIKYLLFLKTSCGQQRQTLRKTWFRPLLL